MKLKKKLLFNISLILLFMTLFLIGCSDSSEVAKLDSNEDIKNEGLPLVLTDQMERKVTVEKLPERIVSLSPANTEILYALTLEIK